MKTKEEKEPLLKKKVKTLDSFNEALHEIRSENSKINKKIIKRTTKKNNNIVSKKRLNNNKSSRR
jgi:hypothetical protein